MAKNTKIKAEIKRLNTRLVAIANEFGRDSSTYRNILAKISSSELEQHFHEIQNGKNAGILQLNAKNSDIERKGFKSALQLMRRNARTILSYRDRDTQTKEEIIEETEDYYYMEEEIANRLEYLYSMYTDSELREKYPQLYKSEKMTVEELNNLLGNDDFNPEDNINYYIPFPD